MLILDFAEGWNLVPFISAIDRRPFYWACEFLKTPRLVKDRSAAGNRGGTLALSILGPRGWQSECDLSIVGASNKLEKMRTRNFTTPAYFPREGPHPTMKFNDRLSIAYKVWDQPGVENAPPAAERFNLLFLHGSQMLKEIWTYYAELAFKKWGAKLDKVIAMDIVTHGDSALLNATKITAWSSWPDIGRDAGLVLDDLAELGEVDGPVIAIGHSMGGASVLFLSLMHSSKIEAMVLMDPIWGGSWPQDLDTDSPVNRAMGEIFSKIFLNAREEFSSREDYEQFMSTRFLTRTFHPRIRQDMIEHHVYTDINGKLKAKVSRSSQGGAYLSGSSVVGAATTAFKWSPVPALVMRGDELDWNPLGDIEELVERLPKAELMVVEGGGHLVFFEKPDETFAAMTDYVDRQVRIALKRRQKYDLDAEITGYTDSQVREELELMIKHGRRTSFAKL